MTSEWTSVAISDLVEIKHGFAFKGEYFSDEPTSLQLTTPGNFAVGGGFRPGKGKFYKGPVPKEFVLQPGDLIVTMTDLSKAADTLGYAGVVPNTPHTTWLHNQRVGLVRAKPGAQVHMGFLHYLLRGPAYRDWIVASATGSTVKHTSPSRIGAYFALLPSLHTQKRISEVLGTLDDRITLLRETNATLEAIAQAIFKSWFVDFDPVHAKMKGDVPTGMSEATAALFPEGFEKTQRGLVPTGWSVGKLATFVESYGGIIQTGPFGSQLHASDYVADGVPVVMPKDISLRRINTGTIARVAEEDAERLSRHRLQPGDIVFSRRGDVERHAFVTQVERGWLCGTGCLLIRPGPHNPAPTFLSLFLDTPAAKSWLVQHAVGATMPNLNTGILGAVPLVSPPCELLMAFEHVVSVLETSRSENECQAETLAALRDTLLPRLISGQLRIPDAQAALEQANAL